MIAVWRYNFWVQLVDSHVICNLTQLKYRLQVFLHAVKVPQPGQPATPMQLHASPSQNRKKKTNKQTIDWLKLQIEQNHLPLASYVTRLTKICSTSGSIPLNNSLISSTSIITCISMLKFFKSMWWILYFKCIFIHLLLVCCVIPCNGLKQINFKLH